jgi:hypothetical protein
MCAVVDSSITTVLQRNMPGFFTEFEDYLRPLNTTVMPP